MNVGIGGTEVQISDKVSMVLRAMAPVTGGTRWEYDVLVHDETVIRESDLVTSDFGPESASRVAAGALLGDLENPKRQWAEYTRSILESIRPDLEGWGGCVRGR